MSIPFDQLMAQQPQHVQDAVERRYQELKAEMAGQRYSPCIEGDDSPGMEPDPEGEWVRYLRPEVIEVPTPDTAEKIEATRQQGYAILRDSHNRWMRFFGYWK